MNFMPICFIKKKRFRLNALAMKKITNMILHSLSLKKKRVYLLAYFGLDIQKKKCTRLSNRLWLKSYGVSENTPPFP